MKKEKIIIWLIALIVFIVILVLYIPVMKKNHQIRMLQKEIIKMEKEIELNSSKREECSLNMVKWREDNDKNREMLSEMYDNYDNMVGFQRAWQKSQ